KFTDSGKVSLEVKPVQDGWSIDTESLNKSSVIGFFVRDTGIGISEDHHRVIFESFQQADGGSSRRYGGVGLGLAISREIAILLGGELRLIHSKPGEGSTFALFLPQQYLSQAKRLDNTLLAGGPHDLISPLKAIATAAYDKEEWKNG